MQTQQHRLYNIAFIPRCTQRHKKKLFELGASLLLYPTMTIVSSGQKMFGPEPSVGHVFDDFSTKKKKSNSKATSYTVGFVSRKGPYSTEAQIGIFYAVQKWFFESTFLD